jgi:hypothetical protein
MSALIESRAFSQAGGVNPRTLKVIVGCLAELYTNCEFLQESIAAVFVKLLLILKGEAKVGLAALEIIVEALIINRGKKGEGEASGSFDFKANILSDSNRLALFLRLKEVYLESYSGQSKEYVLSLGSSTSTLDFIQAWASS